MEHEREIAELRRLRREADERAAEVERDWERKRRDSSVPGAPAPDDDSDAADGGAVAGDWEGEGPAAGRAGQ